MSDEPRDDGPMTADGVPFVLGMSLHKAHPPTIHGGPELLTKATSPEEHVIRREVFTHAELKGYTPLCKHDDRPALVAYFVSTPQGGGLDVSGWYSTPAAAVARVVGDLLRARDWAMADYANLVVAVRELHPVPPDGRRPARLLGEVLAEMFVHGDIHEAPFAEYTPEGCDGIMPAMDDEALTRLSIAGTLLKLARGEPGGSCSTHDSIVAAFLRQRVYDDDGRPVPPPETPNG